MGCDACRRKTGHSGTRNSQQLAQGERRCRRRRDHETKSNTKQERGAAEAREEVGGVGDQRSATQESQSKQDSRQSLSGMKVSRVTDVVRTYASCWVWDGRKREKRRI